MVAKRFAEAAAGLQVIDPNALPDGPAKTKAFKQLYKLFGARYPELDDLVAFEAENHYENGTVRVVVDQKGKVHGLTSFVPLPASHTTALTYFLTAPNAPEDAARLLAAEVKAVMTQWDAAIPVFELQQPGTSEPDYAERDAQDRAIAAALFGTVLVPISYKQTKTPNDEIVLSNLELHAGFPPDMTGPQKNQLLAAHMRSFRELDDPGMKDPENRAGLAADLQAIRRLKWQPEPARPAFKKG